MATDGSVTVAVRVRPLTEEELRRKDEVVVKMHGTQTTLLGPGRGARGSGGTAGHVFHFDQAYWSVTQRPSYNSPASQCDVFRDLGLPALRDALRGYNSCVFAYGQTGSGKSYSMFGEQTPAAGRRGRGSDAGSQPGDSSDRASRGSARGPSLGRSGSQPRRGSAPVVRPRSASVPRGGRRGQRGEADHEQRGLVPRLCEALFAKAAERPDIEYRFEVSYFQIYLERVSCLLNPTGATLKVREHPLMGPYVEDLTSLVVESERAALRLVAEGNRARRVAHTRQNHLSSRSHAVFSLVVTQTQRASPDAPTVRSKVSAVDLAGSERAARSGSSGDQVIEACNINRSLSTLGKVISQLASGSRRRGASKQHVPYRDSVLTWLLRESLGGNSKTAMLATISPSLADYEETLSTLRYADQAKRIVNQAVVNEVSNKKIVSELKSEVRHLQDMLRRGAGAHLQEQLANTQKLLQTMSQTWEEKLAETQRVLREREAEALKLQQERDRMGFEVRRLSEQLAQVSRQRDDAEWEKQVERAEAEAARRSLLELRADYEQLQHKSQTQLTPSPLRGPARRRAQSFTQPRPAAPHSPSLSPQPRRGGRAISERYSDPCDAATRRPPVAPHPRHFAARLGSPRPAPRERPRRPPRRGSLSSSGSETSEPPTSSSATESSAATESDAGPRRGRDGPGGGHAPAARPRLFVAPPPPGAPQRGGSDRGSDCTLSSSIGRPPPAPLRSPRPAAHGSALQLPLAPRPELDPAAAPEQVLRQNPPLRVSERKPTPRRVQRRPSPPRESEAARPQPAHGTALPLSARSVAAAQEVLRPAARDRTGNRAAAPACPPGDADAARLRGSAAPARRRGAERGAPSEASDSDGSPDDAVFEELTIENTREAVRVSNETRRRIDDDYRRHQLGLKPLRRHPAPRRRAGNAARRQHVRFADAPEFVPGLDCASTASDSDSAVWWTNDRDEWSLGLTAGRQRRRRAHSPRGAEHRA